MPDFDRDTGQMALLEAYERALTGGLDAAPPADLDPALAATARALTRQLGTPPAGQTAAPTAAFRASLRQRLVDQAASYPAIPARTAPPSAAATDRHLPTPSGHERRRASFGPRGTAPAAPQRTDATGDAPAIPARPQAASGTTTPHRRPLRTAVSNSVGWLGAALVIAVVILAATLLLRGLPSSTPATQPTLPLPSAVPAPSAPLPTATVAQPTVPAALTATPRPATPLWQGTGALNLPRAKHSATRLADGRVLVAGGYGNSGGGEASAEIFDPQTGTWSATGAMGTPRIEHGALLLPDGQVLVAGGFNNSVNNNTTSVTGAERYDPITGQWRPTAAPPVGLGLVRMALLADGRALLISSSPAGRPSDERPLTALLYDTSADRWSELGTLDFTIVPLAVPLADGRALLLGEAGQTNDGTTPVLLLDPATGATTPAPLPDARGGFSATALPDGDVLVAGGMAWSDQIGGQPTPLASALRFDPQTATWTETTTMITPRSGQAAVALTDGRVLVVGGEISGGQGATTAELYSPQSRTWTNLGATGARARHSFPLAPLADGRALVVGGDAGSVRSEYLSEVQLVTPPSGAGATTSTGPGAATPGPSSGIADWNSPSAGLLFHNGRGYRLGGPTLPDGSAPQVGAQVGSTLLRWQSGGVFPANASIYAVQGQPTEEWLIMRDGVRVILYRHDDDTTALLAGIQVVEGRVAGDGATVCPGYGCPATPTTAQQGTVATANRVRVERVLQGSIIPGAEIEVRQMGVPVADGAATQIATPHPGERVLLFLQPAQGQSIGDFGTGDYYWTGLGWAYGFVGETIVPLGSGGVQTPLDRFEAAIREIFAPVTPRAPTDPIPTARPVPTATRPTAAPPTPMPGP